MPEGGCCPASFLSSFTLQSCLAHHQVLYQEVTPRTYQKTSQPGQSNLLSSENMGSKQGGSVNSDAEQATLLENQFN